MAAVGCYAQLKPGIGAVDGVDLVLGLPKNSKSLIISTTCQNDKGEVHCEIAEADFYVGSYSIGDRTRAFRKCRRLRLQVHYCTIPPARGISRSDALENVLKMPRKSLLKISRKLF